MAMNKYNLNILYFYW